MTIVIIYIIRIMLCFIRQFHFYPFNIVYFFTLAHLISYRVKCQCLIELRHTDKYECSNSLLKFLLTEMLVLF